MSDVFVSHASEDKELVARPLSVALQAQGLTVWLDAQDLNVGDSLKAKLEEGLREAQFGIVILSPNFLRKEWPLWELDAMVQLEQPPDRMILPVWHELTADDIKKAAPRLAEKVGAATKSGLDEVVIRLVRAIRKARNQADGEWLKFNEKGIPDEAAINNWLQAGESRLSKPYIAWPGRIVALMANLEKRQPSLALATPIEGRAGWYTYEGREIRQFELDFLSGLPVKIRRWNELFPERLFNLANGLKEYGKGYLFADRAVRNFMVLWFRHLQNELQSANSYFELSPTSKSSYLDEIRELIPHGSKELASAHVSYTHQPNHFDLFERSLPGFRMWGPRKSIESARNTRQWYVPADLFEEHFLPQIEFQMMLKFDRTAVIYSAHRERWTLSSFKDENGEHI